MSNHIELAKKIKALADKGIGGEKQNAETILNALMKKHNITIEEIEGDKLVDYFFKINEADQKLWHQIVKRVNRDIMCFGVFPKNIIKKHSLKGNNMISCTTSEYIEIEAKFSFYKKLYAEELDLFYTAFLQANNLLLDAKEEQKEMTDKEYEEWKRVDGLSKKIKVGHFKKQLN